MKLKDLFERTLGSFTGADVYRFKRMGNEPDINPEDVEYEETERTKEKIMKFIRNGRIKIYRAQIFVDDPVDSLKKKPLVGMSWTYDLGAADSYRGKIGGFGEKYILETEIKEEYIDWERTLALNTIRVRGNIEREIRLFKGTPIILKRMYHDQGSVLKEVDISEIEGMKLRTR